MVGSDRFDRAEEPAFSWIFSRTFLLVLLLIVLIVLGGRHFLRETSLFDPDAAARVVTPRGDLAQDERATIELFQAASPAVVGNELFLRGRSHLYCIAEND